MAASGRVVDYARMKPLHPPSRIHGSVDRVLRRLLPGVLWALFALHFSARADLVHLANGKVIQGEVIEETERYIIVRVPYGQIKLRMDEVEFIERQTNQEYRLDLSRDYLRQRKFTSAIEELVKARAVDGESKEIRQALVQACQLYGQHLTQVNRLTEAKKYFARVLALQPDSKEGQAGVASAEAGTRRLDGLLAQAQAAAAANDLDGAIAVFIQALEFSPDARERVAGELAQCLAARAGIFYKARRYEEAAQDLEHAFGLEPRLANELEGLYAASSLSGILRQVQEGKGDGARQALARVLTFAPTSPLVLYVAGRFEEALANWKGAADFYARSSKAPVLRTTPDGVADLRVKAEAALKIPDGGARIVFNVQPLESATYAQSTPGTFAKLETEHFTILHHNAALAAEAGAVFEAHFARIQLETGLTTEWKTKPKVFLHRTQEAYTLATSQAAWTGGVSRFVHQGGRGLAKMEIHSWQTSPRLLKSVIPHELAHLIVNSNMSSYEELPRALHEGFSILMEPEFRQQYFLQFLRMRLNGKEFIPLAELLAMKEYPRDPDFFYAEGFCLVAYLARKFGLPQVIGLVRNPQKKTGIEEALLGLTGAASLERLEADWKSWIVNQK